MPRKQKFRDTPRALRQRRLRYINARLKRKGLRLCPRCLRRRGIKDFVKERGYCIACRRVLAVEWAARNRKRCALNSKTWRQEKKINVPFFMAVSAARCRAKKIGVPFDISYEDLLPLPERCPVFGIPLVYDAGGAGVSSGKPMAARASLDRLVPEKGYVKGNVSVISWRANFLKRDASLEELEKLVDWLKSRQQVPESP